MKLQLQSYHSEHSKVYAENIHESILDQHTLTSVALEKYAPEQKLQVTAYYECVLPKINKIHENYYSAADSTNRRHKHE